MKKVVNSRRIERTFYKLKNTNMELVPHIVTARIIKKGKIITLEARVNPKPKEYLYDLHKRIFEYFWKRSLKIQIGNKILPIDIPPDDITITSFTPESEVNYYFEELKSFIK